MADVHQTRSIRGSETWSDHWLVRCKVAFRARREGRLLRRAFVKKLDVSKLRGSPTKTALQDALNANFSANLVTDWPTFKTQVYDAAMKVLGVCKRKHQDWFDDQDLAAKSLLDDLNAAHLLWINDKKSTS